MHIYIYIYIYILTCRHVVLHVLIKSAARDVIMNTSYSTSVASTSSSVGAERCSTTADDDDDDSLSMSDVTDELDPEALSPRAPSGSPPAASVARSHAPSSIPPPSHCSSPISLSDATLPPSYGGRKTNANNNLEDDIKPPKLYFLHSSMMSHHRGVPPSSLDVATLLRPSDIALHSMYKHRCVTASCLFVCLFVC